MKRMKMNECKAMTFEEGCEEYLLNCRARNLREGTIKHYKDSMKQLFKYIAPDMPISTMDSETMGKVVIAIKNNSNINDMSLYTYTRDLKTLMYFFMKCDYIPTFKISLAKADKQPIETYSDYELRKLLKKPNMKKSTFTEYKSWVIVNFLLSTGIRQRSLINIKIKDIDFYNGVVNVNVTKSRKPLIIPLNSEILKIMQEYLKYRNGNDEDYLFCNVYGSKLTKSTVYHSLFEYNKGRGVETTGMHRFRHTFAKKWVTMGGSVVILQKVLGHSSLAITENYLNILTCDVQKEMEKYNILQEFNRKTIKIESKLL